MLRYRPIHVIHAICSVLMTVVSARKYNTRQKDDFHIDVIKSEIGKRNIKYNGSKLCNDLPAELKEIQSLQSFKYKLKIIYCNL